MDDPVQDRAEAAVPPPRAVAAHVEALNLAGLGFATKRLLGKDPAPVSGQFTMWQRSGKAGLPGLTDRLWAALEPLRIGRPSSPAAALCDRVLHGRERDGELAARAAADCAAAGKARFRAAPLVLEEDDDREEILTQRALVDAVKDAWRGLGTAYTEVRATVVAGDLRAAVELLQRHEEALRPTIERMEVLAVAVAGAAGPEVAEPAASPTPEPAAEELPDETVERVQDHPTGSRPLTEEQAAAFAQQRPLREERDPAPGRPVEVLSTRPVRNHPFLPIIFLLVVSGVALFVLYSIINDPTNPLAS